MLLILLKSSACLAIFIIFYKLCLEKTSAHAFKRFYLIAAILLSIGIPFITVVEYVETQPLASTFTPEFNSAIALDIIETKSFQYYIPSILWSIYILGVVLFLLRFFKNLYQLFQTIKKNPKFKNQNFINVLLKDLITPHTFFNYIFLNKSNYENKKIPEEVLLHEQTHAKQKHALDIIFIEALQILFWFNPLLYLIKKDIKLNHEFLADQAVINKGTNTKDYQKLLLAFSSNVTHSSLANAINYSLIKKRFTVMKTKTSKTSFWVRSLFLLPILAITLYSFSDKKEVVKVKSTFKNDETPQILLPQEVEKDYSLETKLKPFKNLKINYPDDQQKATPEEIAEYNKIVKKLNAQPENKRIIKQEDVIKLKYIYGIMTKEQKESAEPFPNFPPPPPGMDTLYTYNRLAKRVQTIAKNRKANTMYLKELYSQMSSSKKSKVNSPGVVIKSIREDVDEVAKTPPSPPATKEPELIEIIEVKPTKAPKAPKAIKGKMEHPEIIEIKEIPSPPPPPKSAYDFVKSLKDDDITYYYNEKKVSYDNVLKITKKEPNINIITNIKNNKGTVKFWSVE